VDGTTPVPYETARLAAVKRYEILDTPRDGAFDNIAQLAARTFRVPIAIISIVDHDRIWFKSHAGVDIEQVKREPGLCASAILLDHPTVVVDASLDPRSMANSLVAGELGLRFYAAAPLRTSDGYNLGTLCIADKVPHKLSAEEQQILCSMAAIVVDQLEMRLSARKSAGHARETQSGMEETIIERTEQLARLSQELLRSSEDERAKLAADLHDDMGSVMTLLMLTLGDVGRGLSDAEPKLRAQHRATIGLVQELVASQRRIVDNLRPVVLDTFGLAVALRIHSDAWAKNTGIRVEKRISTSLPPLDVDAALALFRIVQESLTNIAKYARASLVFLSLAIESGCVVVAIEDNGIGIAPATLRAPSSHGISGMRERLLRFGGNLSIEYGDDHIGTRVAGMIPVESALQKEGEQATDKGKDQDWRRTDALI